MWYLITNWFSKERSFGYEHNLFIFVCVHLERDKHVYFSAHGENFEIVVTKLGYNPTDG